MCIPGATTATFCCGWGSPRDSCRPWFPSGGCNCVEWFRENLTGCHRSHRDLEGECFDGTEPIFLPFLHGERCPGWDDGRSGEFVGLRGHHDVTALYRSIQEGVLFNLLQCYKALVELNGPPTRLKVSGGILNSPRWTQMCADVLGVPLEVDATMQASLKGGAICAMEVAGLSSTAAGHESPPSSIIRPNPVSHDRHQMRNRTYLRAYHPWGAP